MKPWEFTGTDEALLPYWDKLGPEDFYFAIEHHEGTTMVCITPIEYFNSAGRLYVDSMPISRHLPHYLVETIECVYEADEPLSTVFEDMIECGFVHDRKFQSFVDVAI